MSMSGLKAPSPIELLCCWERGLTQSPLVRPLSLLSVSCPRIEYDALARMSIGQRDMMLLRLRVLIFGPKIDCVSTCPACSDSIEMSFTADDIASKNHLLTAESSLCLKDYEVRFHLPNSLDMTDLIPDDLAKSKKLLLWRCFASASCRGESISAEELPDEVVNAVIEEMALLDPIANIKFAISCPSCGHEWSKLFDISSFFWMEINAWAVRMLKEVHILAQAYGWSEREILELSPLRRQIYLEMAST
jgi:hypothetical protein